MTTYSKTSAMINLLEEFPLNTPIMTEDRQRCTIKELYQNPIYRPDPCLHIELSRFAATPNLGTVLNFMEIFVSIATDNKFIGGDTRVLYTVSGRSRHEVGKLVMKWTSGSPIIIMEK